MLYREMIAVCSQIHTKHINTLCGQNVDLLNAKRGSTGQEVKILSGSVGFVLLTECRFVSARGCYVALLHVNVLPYRTVLCSINMK